jgi:hypothetical protein
MCRVWISLEDVDPDAGPQIYKPGSHWLPEVNMQDVGVKGRPEFGDYERCYEPVSGARMEASGLPTKQLLLRKGQASPGPQISLTAARPSATPR